MNASMNKEENKITPVKDIEMLFSQRLKSVRTKAGLTQQQFADTFKISVAALSNYETGKRLPDIEITARIAQRFGVSSDYLLGLSGVQSTEQDIQTSSKHSPCPFCGSDDVIADVLRRKLTVFYCKGCESLTIFRIKRKADAIAAYNTRTEGKE